ncbi:hypothetical protein VP424E501_P0237 [Vibrio phage 424E50-1]|nr:hypothetical protein VP424E501_P0237 [Vibrio phage 424E50-1]
MIISESYKNGHEVATVIGDEKALTFTYEGKYLSTITHTFKPATGKYLTITQCTQNDNETLIKYIKESIIFAKQDKEEDYE